MRYLILIFALSIPLFAVDDITCGMTGATVQGVLNAATCGKTLLIQAQTGGSQCSYTKAGGFSLPDVAGCTGMLVNLTLASDGAGRNKVTGCSINGSQPGSGYTTAPSVTVLGNGSGAAVHVTLSGGAGSTCVVDSQGSGYDWAEAFVEAGDNTITLVSDELASLPAAGRRIGTMYVSGGWVIKGGSGYTNATCSCGSVASCSVTVGGGQVTGVTLTDLGTGPQKVPACTVSGDGTGAAIQALIGPYVTSAQRLHLPSFQTTDNSGYTFTKAASGKTPWKLSGLEITTSYTTYSNPLGALVGGNSGSHLYLDRSFLHGANWPNNTTPPYHDATTTGYDQCGNNMGTTGNVIDVFGTVGDSNFGIGLSCPNGPHKIVNNMVEAWYNAIFFGGSDVAPTNPATINASPTPTVGSATPCSGATCGSATVTCTGSCSLSTLSAGMAITIQMPFDAPRVTANASRDNTGKVTFTCTGGNCPVVSGGEVNVAGFTNTTFNSGSLGTLCPYISCGPVTVIDATHFSILTGNTTVASDTGGNVGPGYCKTDYYKNCYQTAWVNSVNAGTGVVTYTTVTGYRYCGRAGKTGPCDGSGGANDSYQEYLTTIDVVAPSNTAPVATGSGIMGWQGPQTHGVYVAQNFISPPSLFSYYQRKLGNTQDPKGYDEMKDCNGCLIDGNVFDGYPSTVPTNSVNQSGQSPFSYITNMQFSNNWVRRTGQIFPFGLAGEGSFYNNPQSKNIRYRNNLFAGFDGQGISQKSPALWPGASGGVNLEFSHNTVMIGYADPMFGCQASLGGAGVNTNGDCNSSGTDYWTWYPNSPATGYPSPAMTWKDNVMGYNNYGFGCLNNNTQATVSSMANCWPSPTITNNLIVLGTNDGTLSTPNTDPRTYFTTGANGNQIANSWTNPSPPAAQSYATAANAGMVDPANGNYNLSATSIGHSAASDGTDMGFNATQINAVLGLDNPLLPANASGSDVFGGTVVLSGTVVIQ